MFVQYGNKYLNNMMHVDTGEHWKAMRNAVAPVFTSGKIRCGLLPAAKLRRSMGHVCQATKSFFD